MSACALVEKAQSIGLTPCPAAVYWTKGYCFALLEVVISAPKHL